MHNVCLPAVKQLRPLPLNPSLHSQLNEPTVFVQFALL